MFDYFQTMKIKICGITCSENFKAIRNYAIDFIGLNFYKKVPDI